MRTSSKPIEFSDMTAAKTPKDRKESKERGNWTRKLDFFLACVGYAVGLGNIWRFPYLCMKNGGGAFLIPYFFCLITCGIPLFFLELALGQFSSLSALPVWRLCPLFKGLGYASTLVTGILAINYNMVLAWILYYLGKSFTQSLPWADCSHNWNTPKCLKRGLNHATTNSTNITMWLSWTNASTEADYTLGLTNITRNITMYGAPANLKTMTPSEEFWQLEMLQLSTGIEDMGEIRWQLVLCLAAAWILVFLCLCKGVKSAGKVVYVTVILPYLLLLILVIRGCMLPGSYQGIKFYLVPDFKRLLDFNVWVEAFIQVFFSLGPAWGTLITMSSFNKFNNNCYRDSMLLPCINGGTSFLAGFAVFSMVGFMAKESGLPIKDIITSGPGLTFIVFPDALTKLPVSPFWAVLFFIMLLTLGLDTQFGMVKTVIYGIIDLMPGQLMSHRTLITAAVCALLGIIGLPLTTKGGMYLFQIYDWYCSAFTIFLIGILECVVLCFCYGVNRFCYDIKMMTGRQPGLVWKICWCAITPGILLAIFIITCSKFKPPVYGDYVYPSWAEGVGWFLATVSAVPIPLVMIIEISKAKGSLKQRVVHLLKPEADWGPAQNKDRVNYKYLKSHNVTHVTSLIASSQELEELKTGLA